MIFGKEKDLKTFLLAMFLLLTVILKKLLLYQMILK